MQRLLALWASDRIHPFSSPETSAQTRRMRRFTTSLLGIVLLSPLIVAQDVNLVPFVESVNVVTEAFEESHCAVQEGEIVSSDWFSCFFRACPLIDHLSSCSSLYQCSSLYHSLTLRISGKRNIPHSSTMERCHQSPTLTFLCRYRKPGHIRSETKPRGQPAVVRMGSVPSSLAHERLYRL